MEVDFSQLLSMHQHHMVLSWQCGGPDGLHQYYAHCNEQKWVYSITNKPCPFLLYYYIDITVTVAVTSEHIGYALQIGLMLVFWISIQWNAHWRHCQLEMVQTVDHVMLDETKCEALPQNREQVTFWVKWVFGIIVRTILPALIWYQNKVCTPILLWGMTICVFQCTNLKKNLKVLKDI